MKFAAIEPLETRRLLAALPVNVALEAASPQEAFAISADAGIALAGPLTSPGLDESLRQAIALANSRYADYAATHTAEQFADFTAADGAWVTGSANTWVAGFTPGILWELDEAANRDGNVTRAWELRAGQWARRLLNGNALTEDVGFRMLSGLEPWLARLQAAGRASDAEVVAKRMEQEARQKLDTRWNETVGTFRTTWRSSSNPEADYGTIIDQTYDLALLQWLAGRVSDSDPALATLIRSRVQRHAQRVADHIVRPDGSSYHWGYFNSTSGQFVQGETFQGYANDSTWARGQAWGIMGFAEAARRAAGSGGAADPQMLALGRDTAIRLAEFLLAHLPADKVPFWDFDDPAIPNAPRDSSAAAIAASGLITLAGLPGLSTTLATTYRAAAEGILLSLATGYLSAGRIEDSVIVHGSGNVPAGGAVDRGLIYGDYFFLRAANDWLGAPTGSPGAGGDGSGGTDPGAGDDDQKPRKPGKPAKPRAGRGFAFGHQRIAFAEAFTQRESVLSQLLKPSRHPFERGE